MWMLLTILSQLQIVDRLGSVATNLPAFASKIGVADQEAVIMRAAPTLAARLLGLGIAAAALGVAVPPAARADWHGNQWHGGSWHGGGAGWHGGSWGWHGGRWNCCWRGGVFIGVPPVYAPPPVYYPPYYYPPAYYPPAPYPYGY
jgi:hypothetical protein